MTEVLAARTVPAPLAGGTGRRFVVVVVSVLTWTMSLLFGGAGIRPGSEGPTGWSIRVAFCVLSAVLLVLPVVVLVVPAQRRVRRQLSAILAVAADHPVPVVPPFETWCGPSRMFRRLMVSSCSYTAIPLLLLVGSAVAFGLFLAEPWAGAVFAVLALVPLFVTVITLRLPRRLSSAVRAGLEAGQVVPVQVDSRIDQTMVVGDAFMSWFHTVLPDGQRVTLRTPMHFAWAVDARGVVDSPDLVLVVGRSGHQGLLLLPSRPQDAIWLLGPVPLVRVPRSVQKAFAAYVTDRTPGP